MIERFHSVFKASASAPAPHKNPVCFFMEFPGTVSKVYEDLRKASQVLTCGDHNFLSQAGIEYRIPVALGSTQHSPGETSGGAVTPNCSG